MLSGSNFLFYFILNMFSENLSPHSFILYIQLHTSLYIHTPLSYMAIHLYTELHLFSRDYTSLFYVQLHLSCLHTVTHHTQRQLYISLTQLSPYSTGHTVHCTRFSGFHTAPAHPHTHVYIIHLLFSHSLSLINSLTLRLPSLLSAHSAIFLSQHTHTYPLHCSYIALHSHLSPHCHCSSHCQLHVTFSGPNPFS